MKKLLAFLFLALAVSANAQTFTVQNLQVNGTTNLTGAVTGTSASFTGPNTFTGATTAVTQPPTDNSTLVATDAFTNQQIIRSTETLPLTLTGGVYNQGSLGSGFSPVIFASGGVVTSILTIANPGSGYAVGDLVVLAGGNFDAQLRVSSVSGGGVTAVTVLYGGTGYTTGVQLSGMLIPPGDRNVVLTGVLTSNVTFIIAAGTFNTASRRVSFANNTTGAFTVTVFLSNGAGGTTGSGYVLPQGTANSTSVLLQTDGETNVWPVTTAAGIGAGTGTVTSVQVSGGTTGLTFSGGPITTSGTITQAGTLAIANGGTGQTTAAAAFNAISPMTTTGDTIYETSTGVAARLPIGTTSQVYTVVSGKPAWATPATGVAVVSGFINGFTLSNDGTTPNSVLDEAAGYASDSANAVMITGTVFKKSTAGTWVAGSGGNGMGTGLTIAASTWYHVFAIVNAGAYDVYYDTSPTAANAPAGTTAFRYIGSFRTNASSQILGFAQNGQKFKWVANVTDLSGGTATSQTNVSLTTPPGFVTYPTLVLICSTAAAGGDCVVYPSTLSAALADDMFLYTPVATQPTSSGFTTTTNTSSQISYSSSGTTPSVTIQTTGYINPHVAPNF